MFKNRLKCGTDTSCYLPSTYNAVGHLCNSIQLLTYSLLSLQSMREKYIQSHKATQGLEKVRNVSYLLLFSKLTIWEVAWPVENQKKNAFINNCCMSNVFLFQF